jgi:hypothetical protein
MSLKFELDQTNNSGVVANISSFMPIFNTFM